MSTIKRLAVALAVLLAPLAAHAQNNESFRLGVGGQMTCVLSPPTHVATRGSFYCSSADSNKLHYVDPSGTDSAIGTGGASLGNFTLTLNSMDMSSGGATMYIGSNAGAFANTSTLVIGPNNTTLVLLAGAAAGTASTKTLNQVFLEAVGASSGTTLVNTPSVTWRPHYWNGSVDTTYPIDVTGVMDATTPTAHLGYKFNSVELFQLRSSGTFNLKANGSIGQISQSTTNTIGMTLNPNVADGASSVALNINPTTTLSNASAVLLQIQNNGSTRFKTLLNSSDGFVLVDGGGVAKLALSTNVGAVFGYSSATFSAGSGSVTMTDGTGSIGISAGNLTLTILQGVPDADGTRDWGVLGTRWRVGGFKRLIQGEQNLSFSATPAFDCTAGNAIHIGTITGNITGPTMVSGSAGEQCTIVFQKDGTGGAYTITASWGSNVRATASTFTTGAGSLVILHFFWDANLTTPAWVLTSGLAYN